MAFEEIKRRDVLVLIHGYRTTFPEALKATALLATELRFGGVPLCFSWPSAGTLAGYWKDEEAAAESPISFHTVIKDLVLQGGAEVHAVAHSMGNRVLTGALYHTAMYNLGALPTLKQLLLVAPDVRRDTCVDQWNTIRAYGLGSGSTCYYSRQDLPLLASKWLHGTARAGLSDWGASPVDAIDVSPIQPKRWSIDAHSPHVHVPRVLADMHEVIRAGTPAADRLLDREGNYYIMRE